MIYQPSKKELKQIENLNKGYKLIKEGIKVIRDNIPKKDGDIEMQAYKIGKNFDKIIKRIHVLLEKQYVDSEFIDIVNTKAPKRKGGRFDKNGKNKKKKG